MRFGADAIMMKIGKETKPRTTSQRHSRGRGTELADESSVTIARYVGRSPQPHINFHGRRSNVTTDLVEPGVAESLPSRM